MNTTECVEQVDGQHVILEWIEVPAQTWSFDPERNLPGHREAQCESCGEIVHAESGRLPEQQPTRNTHKGHGRPERFVFLGFQTWPDDYAGIPVRVVKRGHALVFRAVDDDREIDWCGVATKFWALPIEPADATS
jgi:hypothetical protein